MLRREGLYTSLIATCANRASGAPKSLWLDRQAEGRPIPVIVRSSVSTKRSTGWPASSTSPDGSSRSKKKLSALLEQFATDSAAENDDSRLSRKLLTSLPRLS